MIPNPSKASQQFESREQAGQALATALERYRNEPGLLILGMARGGVPVAAPVARELGAELDVLVIRKIRAPGYPELAIGAVGPGNVQVLNQAVIVDLGISAVEVADATKRARSELEDREQHYHRRRPSIPFAGRTVIIVDDGLATGASLEAAIATVRKGDARRVIAAVPVAAPDAVSRLSTHADHFLALEQPDSFGAVSLWYRSFGQISDDAVMRCIVGFRDAREKSMSSADFPADTETSIPKSR